MKRTIALFGAGKIGQAITALLCGEGYSVLVCDHHLEQAQKVAQQWDSAEGCQLDLKDPQAVLNILNRASVVVSALPYFCNVDVAKLAAKAGVHYFDLTEDVNVTAEIRSLSKGSNLVFMPQCGLAPGFIGLVTDYLAKQFDSLESIKLRVGALPTCPSNYLKYNLTWSTDGLINEYANLCDAISDGKRVWLQPLEGYENLYIDGVEYEAFNTSGGLGSLATMYEGKVSNLDYKTIRYVGHCHLIKFLMQDLKLSEDRVALKKIFEHAIPGTKNDKCVLFVEVTGQQNGRYMQKTYCHSVFAREIYGQYMTAIALTTAVGVVTPIDMLFDGTLNPATKGFVPYEAINFERFIANRYGINYRDDNQESGI